MLRKVVRMCVNVLHIGYHGLTLGWDLALLLYYLGVLEVVEDYLHCCEVVRKVPLVEEVCDVADIAVLGVLWVIVTPALEFWVFRTELGKLYQVVYCLVEGLEVGIQFG